jgi:ribosome-binding factor A
MRLRYVPELELIEDPVPERATRLDELLDQLRRGESDR